ncbi:MAG: pilus (MSHA type) biogenesis protein MshL [Sulfuritalea sp.]|nr:pilus (MSHA type) biogenesis protein MshL [Sulfuritalea sp.]
MIPPFPAALAVSLILSACGGIEPKATPAGHIVAEPAVVARQDIPAPVAATVMLARPRATAKAELYSVSVRDIPVQELLFALARDAKMNIDIRPGISGLVTLNAFDQTLPQILTRISNQVDMRVEHDGPNLVVMPDKPFLRNYKIDFLNMARVVKSTISTTTQIASAGSGTGLAGNKATTSITSDTTNDLMKSLISNVSEMLKEEDRLRYKASVELATENQATTAGTGAIATNSNLGKTTTDKDGKSTSSGPGGSAAGSGNQAIQASGAAQVKTGVYEPSLSVFANSETGVLIVRATSRQHEKVQLFIDQVMKTAKRQVLIEATIVEVRLNDNYKQGIDWSALRFGPKGFIFSQTGTAGLASANPLNFFTINYANPTSAIGNLAAQISLLESFGKVKVLSSPKLSVMNNQTATLKVADNKIYFTVKADTTTSNGLATTTFTTTPNEVSVGFLMNVTPQISDANSVTINIRPTITRIVSYVNDPNPTLAAAGVVNRVPEIQTREMESIIKIDSGQTAVMGGLMQDDISYLTDSIPGLGDIPGVGNFFRNRNDTSTKTELVIFLKPTVITDPSIDGDYRSFRDQLPKQDFFVTKPGPGQKQIETQGATAQ